MTIYIYSGNKLTGLTGADTAERLTLLQEESVVSGTVLMTKDPIASYGPPGHPMVTAFGYGGALTATGFSLVGQLIEYGLDASRKTAEELTWSVLTAVTVQGTQYFLKINPHGDVAWFVIETGKRTDRMLSAAEVKELGLNGGDNRDNSLPDEEHQDATKDALLTEPDE